MCGRIAYYFDPEDFHEFPLLEKFLDNPLTDYDYNVCQTKPVPALLNNGEVEMIHWGLIPPDAQDDKFHPFNAQAERLTQIKMFREPFRSKRCLVIVSGFYEPHLITRDPYYFHLKSSKIIALAGLWDTWSPQGIAKMNSCTIITTKPNSTVKQIHDRMPVILQPDHWKTWLDRRIQTPGDLEPLLMPYEIADLTYHQAPPFVNKVENNGPECIEPYIPDSEQLYF